MFDDIPNHSMMGVIDDNSNNNEHKFIFAQESKMSKVDEGHSMSMFFKNQHSNSFLMYQGTPKKFEESQHNFFDPGENSNISAMFPRLDNSNNMPKKLFQKEIINENSQFGLGLLQSSHPETPIPEKDIEIEKDSIEVEPKVTQEIINHEIQLQQGVTANMDDCSLPHPNDLFNLKEITGHVLPKHLPKNNEFDTKSIVSTSKQNKRSRKSKRKQDKSSSENR